MIIGVGTGLWQRRRYCLPDEDIARLQEMLEAALVCRHFVDGRSRAELDNDLLLYFAVAKAVELIGEAAQRISGDSRTENPEIEWDEIVGMRHHLVHGFHQIVRDSLWMAAVQDVPVLIGRLQAALGQNQC